MTKTSSMSLTYLSGENCSKDLYDKRHENRLFILANEKSSSSWSQNRESQPSVFFKYNEDLNTAQVWHSNC